MESPAHEDRRSSALEDRVELTDPRAIRALAHRARMIVIDALYDQGISLTATQAAELAGITPSAMSYHLRALERYGIVKRAPARDDARERPYVRVAKDLRLRPSGAASSTAAAAATGAVLSVAFDHDREGLFAAANRIASAGGRLALDVAATYGRTTLLVTPEEAATLLGALHDLIEPWRLEARVDPPVAAGRLNLVIASIPDPDHPGAPAPYDTRS